MTMLVLTTRWASPEVLPNSVVFMADGAIVEHAAPEDFFSNPKSDRAKDFLGRSSTTDVPSKGNDCAFCQASRPNPPYDSPPWRSPSRCPCPSPRVAAEAAAAGGDTIRHRNQSSTSPASAEEPGRHDEWLRRRRCEVRRQELGFAEDRSSGRITVGAA